MFDWSTGLKPVALLDVKERKDVVVTVALGKGGAGSPLRVSKLPGSGPSAVSSSPVDPPPFLLEDEIVLPSRSLALYAIVVGLLILIALRLLFVVSYPLPSLGRLMFFSVGTALLYHCVRSISYWTAWARVTRKYPLTRGIHPAARGELPRNAFLLISILPSATFFPLCVAYVIAGNGFGPEAWLVVAVVASLSIPDMSAGWNLVFCSPDTWIKSNERGLDVLRFVPPHSGAT